jgi:hypothetical protein
VKPRDSSEEEHGLGDGRGDESHFAAKPAPPQGGFGRSASGVVAAAGVPAFRADEEDEKTTVDPASLPMSGRQQEALARRIRLALGQTLPLGTPVPPAPGPRGARSPYARTMILGGRQSPGVLPSEPAAPPEARPPQRREPSRPSRGAVAAPPPAMPPSRAESGAEATGPESNALRASFVREVGLPTAPPPRRSRRPGFAEEGEVGEADHEAFALDRPLTMPPPPPGGTRPPTSGSAPIPAVVRPLQRRDMPPLSTGVMLPPPPQPGDYEPASAPSSVPPAPQLQSSPAVTPGATTLGVAARPGKPIAPRAPAPPLLTELPSANPFEGFEAPRETFAQRFLIVFIVALAVFGMFALAAIAFGFLGKTTGW